MQDIGVRTIKDFGAQWTSHADISGFFGSIDLLADIVFPFNLDEVNGAKVVDLGAGSGRFINAWIQLGARHVVALEPSESIEVVKKNSTNPEMITFLNVPGDSLPAYGDVDLVFSIGVLHHIPDPGPVVKAAYNTLRPGGKFIVWLYGTEGNRLYLALLRTLRALMRALPSPGEKALVWALQYPLRFLIYIGKRFHIRFPLRDYLDKWSGKIGQWHKWLSCSKL
jgi:SAM-dependent methyltransferase